MNRQSRRRGEREDGKNKKLNKRKERSYARLSDGKGVGNKMKI